MEIWYGYGMAGNGKTQNLLPTVFVILGATGDLMQKKLAPALYHLHKAKLLPEMFQVVGFARQDLTHEQFRQNVEGITGLNGDFSKYFVYQQGLFEELAGYKKLAELLGQKDNHWQVCSNKLFYLAVPPQYYETIFNNLADSGLTIPCSPEEGWTRVIVEKPFGKDLQTAQELDRLLGKLFKEEQIYRIDHYLGKETVQNILAFRFSNFFLQDSWNKDSIERISIHLLEKEGIGNRGAFYDGIGALRDVGQNHVLQLLALFTMENPVSFDGESIRHARAKVLESLKKPGSKDIEQYTMRGQYDGYTKEEGIDASSKTETYFKIQTFLETPRWEGTPIILESGKHLAESKAEVLVEFKHTGPCLCPSQGPHLRNVLRYQIQPEERISISFWVKKPGQEMKLEEKSFVFDYREAFQSQEFADAYEKLLLSCIQGDQTSFVSTDEILASWKFIDPIVRSWKDDKIPLRVHPQGRMP